MKFIGAQAVPWHLALVCFVVTCIASGCSATGTDAAQEPRRARVAIPPPSDTGVPGCFPVSLAMDFRVLDRSNLIVYAPDERNAYHVQVGPPSQELRYAESLTFRAPTGRICGLAGERVIIGGLPGSPSGPELSVWAVSLLSTESLELLRAGSGVPPPAEPRPGPGAEIEGAPASDPAEKADSGAEK